MTTPPTKLGGNFLSVGGLAADTSGVLNDLSRRRLLQAGSVFGLLSLVGCASQQTASGDLPGVPWPEAPRGPQNTGSPTKVATATRPNPPILTPQPVPAPGPAQPIGGLPSGVIPRTRWTTAGLANPSTVRPMKGVNCITIHHDGMPTPFFSESLDDSIRRLVSIRDAHTRRKNKSGERWADIGYHFVIDRSGRVFEGRPLAYQGAHVEDCNEHNIGVLCMGNFENQSPSKAQTDRLDGFVADLMRQHRIPLRSVRTHREWPSASTACPGRNLQLYMARTRGRGGAMALTLAQNDPTLLA